MPGYQSLDENVLSRIRRQRSESFLIRLIDLFLREAPPRLEEAWVHARAGEMRGLALSAHTLACLAGNVGAVELRRLAAALEAAAEGGRAGGERIPALLYGLDVAMAEARSCLLAARPDPAR